MSVGREQLHRAVDRVADLTMPGKENTEISKLNSSEGVPGLICPRANKVWPSWAHLSWNCGQNSPLEERP